MRPIIIIPAYQPDAELLVLLEQLTAQADHRIVLVNDGSDPSCTPIFQQAENFPGVCLLSHAINEGKGAALRTGFKYVLGKEPLVEAVVTADADGQHKAADIARICAACGEHPRALILGVRRFDGNVPLRSKLGNGLTRWLYNLLFRQKISDTQTGLRGIPVGSLGGLLTLQAERYSYELEMLLSLNRAQMPVVEIPIATVYENNNRSSNFRVVHDSIQIYATLLRWWLKNR